MSVSQQKCDAFTFSITVSKKMEREGAEETCRVKQERKRGRMKEQGRDRSCPISSTGERLKAWNSILDSTGQAGLVCMGAHFLCVISRKASECVCVCVRTLGVAVQRGLGLFCLFGEERNAQIKHSEQDASTEKERQGAKREGADSQRRGRNRSRDPEGEEKNREKDRFFSKFLPSMKTTPSVSSCGHRRSSWEATLGKDLVSKLMSCQMENDPPF